MNTMKWIAASAFCASSAFAAVAQLDIVVRDFSVDHPDFENFSEEFASTGDDNYCGGSCGDKIFAKGFKGYDAEWYGRADFHRSCGNHRSGMGAMIGVDGNPMTQNMALPDYLRQVSAGPALEYGDCSTGQRNYTNASSTRESIRAASCTRGSWSNKVYYTPGMVQPFLKFDAKMSNGEYDMYDGVHIQKAANLCDNSRFEEWYEDVQGVNYRINRTLDLQSDAANPKLYKVDYNYNNGGYAPLDSVVGGIYQGPIFSTENGTCRTDLQVKGENNTPINPDCKQWGPQSLAIFCPPYDYQYAGDQKGASECAAWKAYGGPKDTAAARQVNAPQFLRNYAFTMMGYAKFKYNSTNQENGGEVFEFVGDDDMWIFVDGVLVVDLGGNHLAAPGAVNIKTLADNNHGCHEGDPLADYSNCSKPNGEAGWANGTWHHLHFFYADRQTDGSNMLIYTSLAELAPSKYGQPAVSEAYATIKDGKTVASMYMSSALKPEVINAVNAEGAKYAGLAVGGQAPADAKYVMVVKRKDANGVEHVYGFLATGVSNGEDKGADGVVYSFTGMLVDENGTIIGNMRSGDAVALNFNASPEVGASMDEYYPWLNDGHAFDIESVTNKRVEGYPNADEWAKVTLTLDTESKVVAQDNKINRPELKNVDKLTDLAGGDELPTDATGELKLIPISLDDTDGDPYAISADVQKALFSNKDRGSVAMNSKLQGKVAGGLCTENPDACVVFNYIMVHPFRINVRVFDHLGHFVSQYSKSMTEEEMQAALGEPAVPAGNCEGDDAAGVHRTGILAGTGALLVGMELYPVSQSGRRLATGPYIYQVTIVEEPSTASCLMMSGEPVFYPGIYTRKTETFTRGYRRLKSK